jgi:hypothetical protein
VLEVQNDNSSKVSDDFQCDLFWSVYKDSLSRDLFFQVAAKTLLSSSILCVFLATNPKPYIRVCTPIRC